MGATPQEQTPLDDRSVGVPQVQFIDGHGRPCGHANSGSASNSFIAGVCGHSSNLRQNTETFWMNFSTFLLREGGLAVLFAQGNLDNFFNDQFV